MHLAIALAISLALTAVTPAQQAGEARPPQASAAAPTHVADLDWMTGHWVGKIGESDMDEIWTPVRGDSIVGMWRIVDRGRTVFYEFLTIEQEESGPVLKLKHFERGLIGWEEKHESVRCPLVKTARNLAVFDNGEVEKPVRLTYRLEGADVLVAVLEKKNKDGKLAATEFRYVRRR